MKSVVPTETLPLKTGERLDDHFLSKGELVLHDDVNDRMKLCIRQSVGPGEVSGSYEFILEL